MTARASIYGIVRVGTPMRDRGRARNSSRVHRRTVRDMLLMVVMVAMVVMVVMVVMVAAVAATGVVLVVLAHAWSGVVVCA